MAYDIKKLSRISDLKTLALKVKSEDDAIRARLSTIEGSDAGKSARTIASEEVAKIVAGADESYDTLKEIADWISTHKGDASAMNTAILKLEGVLAGIGGDGEKATVVEYVTDAIAALKIGDYAKAADLTALAERVTTAETKLATVAEGATKVEASATAGNIKINGTEVTVVTIATDEEVAEMMTEVFGA